MHWFLDPGAGALDRIVDSDLARMRAPLPICSIMGLDGPQAGLASVLTTLALSGGMRSPYRTRVIGGVETWSRCCAASSRLLIARRGLLRLYARQALASTAVYEAEFHMQGTREDAKPGSGTAASESASGSSGSRGSCWYDDDSAWPVPVASLRCGADERKRRASRLKAGGLGMAPLPEDHEDSDDAGQHGGGSQPPAPASKWDDEAADGAPLQQLLDGMAELVAASPLCASMLSGGRVVTQSGLRRLVRLAVAQPVEGAIFMRAVVLMTMWHAVQPAVPGVDDGATLWYSTDPEWPKEVGAAPGGVDARALIGSRVFPFSPGVARGLRRLTLCRYMEDMLPLAAAMLGASVPARAQLTQETSCAVAASISMFVPVATVAGSGPLLRLLARCASAADQLCHRGVFDAEEAARCLKVDTAPLVFLQTSSYDTSGATAPNAGQRAQRIVAFAARVRREERVPLHSCAAASMQAASNRTAVVLPTAGKKESKLSERQVDEPKRKTRLFPLPRAVAPDDGYEPAGVCIGDDGLGEDAEIPAFGNAGAVYLRCLLRQTRFWAEQYLCKPRDQASLPRSSGLSHWAWTDAIKRVEQHCQVLLGLEGNASGATTI